MTSTTIERRPCSDWHIDELLDYLPMSPALDQTQRDWACRLRGGFWRSSGFTPRQIEVFLDIAETAGIAVDPERWKHA